MRLPVLFATLLSFALSAEARVTLSGNYTPSVGQQCPTDVTFVRPANEGLGYGERTWLDKRRPIVIGGLDAYLQNVGLPGLDREAYISALYQNASDVPVIGLTFSGGGTRAELCAFGIYQALDARHPPSVEAGTGGLLQATTYFAGLSGGGLTTVGLATNGFPPVQQLISGGQLNLTRNLESFDAILPGKAELGFSIAVGDLYGIALLTELLKVSGTDVNPFAWTFSGIQIEPAFEKGETPFPILSYNEVIPAGTEGSTAAIAPNGTAVLIPNEEGTPTVVEVSPFEIGSWTGRIKAFADLRYFGSDLTDGKPTEAASCVTGLDTVVYLGGVVVSSLNFWYLEYLSDGVLGQFSKRQYVDGERVPYPVGEDKIEQQRVAADTAGTVELVPGIAALLGETVDDILYNKVPNPFKGYTGKGKGVSSAAASQDSLYLVDGAEIGQENPIWPLIQRERGVDFILVSDNDGTELSSGWMNASSFLNTYTAAQEAGLPFPKIPSVNTMINLNFTSRPALFGCFEEDVPLVLYAADVPYTSYNNLSSIPTFLNADQLNLVLDNGLPLISQDANRLRPNWTECIACAAIYRSLQRMEWTIPEICSSCFSDYCYDGETVDESQPGFLSPSLVLDPTTDWESWNATLFGLGDDTGTAEAGGV